MFDYPEGGVLADNKWRGDAVVEFLKQEGFSIDYSKRDVYYEGEDRKTEIKHRSFLQKVWEVTKSLI